MGLFSVDKLNRSSYETTKQLVFLFANNKIKINSSLMVGDNQEAYVMVNDKITDDFGAGTHTLSVASLPITARALDLHRKSAKSKSIIKTIPADLYVISKENFSVIDKNSFRFVIKDKRFGRVEASINFSCELKVESPLLFLTNIRKFVAVVSKNCAEKMLVDWSKDLTCAIIQKLNIQVDDFMKREEETCQNISMNFAEKMQNLGISVISFNMNKINLSKRMQEAFGNSIKLTPFEQTVKTVSQASKPSEIVFERVGMQGEGNRAVGATLINANRQQETKEVLNIDAFNEIESRPRREFKLNLDLNAQTNNVPQSNFNNQERAVSFAPERSAFAEQSFKEPLRDNAFQNQTRGNAFGGINTQNVTKICRVCGKVLNADDEFCSKCGTRVQ